MSDSWDIPSAVSLYNIDRWGSGYFTINRSGNVQVMPTQQDDSSIDLMEVIQEARDRGMAFPLVIRFQDLLRHRVETVNRAFQSAISEAGYKSVYKGVFPIKVNQLREVVEEIIDAGGPFHFGLEAGSKPELIAALAVHRDPESLIICNGYKDQTYVKIALLGRKLGLSTADLVAASQYLKEEGMADALRLVHFHVGSQVPDIGVVKRAVREAARFFAKLAKMGHPMEFLDVGGGLGVDYDGSRTAFDSSMNYTLQEYARDVVYNIMDVCDSEKVPHPTIISEGGRAIVAHHSVLIVESFGSIEKATGDQLFEIKESDPKLLADIIEIHRTMNKQNRMENLHDAQQIKEQAQSMFELGLLDLESKAKIESIYWRVAEAVVDFCRGMRYVPEEVKELEIALGDQYLCNFSVFQSLLDHWALGQLFPIMPVHHLQRAPDRNGTLVDITCDSDGKVNKFIDLQDVKETLPLHRIRPGEPYYLGFFLMGAYQDIMGDLHNLFGRVNEVHVFLDEDEDSGWYIEEIIEGSTVGSVLSLTQWDKNELIRLVKSQVDAAIKSDRLKPNEAMRLLNEYERGLRGYTYLDFGK